MKPETALFLATLLFWLIVYGVLWYKGRKEEKETPKDLERITIRAEQINIDVLGPILRKIIEGFEQARYTGNLFFVDEKAVEKTFLDRLKEDIDTDERRNVFRELYFLEIGDLKIRQREKAQMFTVSEMEAVAEVEVQYAYHFNGQKYMREERGKRCYLFRHEVTGWKLYGVEILPD